MRRTICRYAAMSLNTNANRAHCSKKFVEPCIDRFSGCKDRGRHASQSRWITQLSTDNKISHWCRNSVMLRLYSTQSTAEEASEEEVPIESELRRKVGWFLKVLAAVTITYVSFNAFPIMGDSLIWQSVALVRLDDPFMKRSGASRISMIATNDKRRQNFVEVGGVEELVKMLESAPDDKTRREAVKALVSLCECEVAVKALHGTGAEGLLKSLAQGSSDADVERQSLALLGKLDQWRGKAN